LARQKRAERSGFALTFFGSFLGQAKKEKDTTARFTNCSKVAIAPQNNKFKKSPIAEATFCNCYSTMIGTDNKMPRQKGGATTERTHEKKL